MAAKGLESVNVCPELSMNNVFIFYNLQITHILWVYVCVMLYWSNMIQI